MVSLHAVLKKVRLFGVICMYIHIYIYRERERERERVGLAHQACMKPQLGGSLGVSGNDSNSCSIGAFCARCTLSM